MRMKSHDVGRHLVRAAGLSLLAAIIAPLGSDFPLSPVSARAAEWTGVRSGVQTYAHVKTKPKRSGVSWTALDGVLSCPSRESAVKLAHLMVGAKHDWRLIEDVRTMVGTEDAESE